MTLFRGRTSLLHQSNFRRIAVFSALTALLLTSIWGLQHRFASSDTSTRKFGSAWVEADQNENPDANPPYLDRASVPQRLIYPYSVIPGGVRNPAELKTVSERDSTVREHYARFNFRKARVVTVRKSRLVYLSYRIGDKIYWTTKKVSLHKGEQLITDGKITARTRCGNRVSSLPQKYGFSREPSAAMFDQPMGPGSSTEIPFPENFHSALESRPNLTGWGPAPLPPGPSVASGLPPLGSGYLPIGSPLVPIETCGKAGNGTCGAAPGPGPGPGSPSTPVPEPGSAELICAEIMAGIFVWRVLSREQT